MLSTIERIIFLKTVSIFSQLPDDALATVASMLDEIEVPPGASIFSRGDPGQAMFIIVAGRVRVYSGEHALNYLGPRDVFGEMALLDAEPRSASVMTVEDTLLLRLDHEAFDDLLADHSAVAFGIIRVLSGRLRARMADLSRLQEQLAARGAPNGAGHAVSSENRHR